MQFKAEVRVTLKHGVLDPQGRAVEGAVKVLGYQNVAEVRVGKYMEVWLEAESAEAAKAQVQDLGQRLLSNPVLESFTFELKPGEVR